MNDVQEAQNKDKKKQRLELTWIGKDEQLKLEPRILIEDPEKSYGDPNTDNMLIHGDNLLALKALEQDFAGKIKCIYIDPPYNTGSAFEHYEDNLEHSIWLSLLKPRLEVIRGLLSDKGLLFIQIDDNEQAYLKVLLDEIFGRSNYLNTIVVKAKAIAGASGGGEDKRLKKNYEFILVYAKDYNQVSYNNIYNQVKLMDYIKEHKEGGVGFYYTRIVKNYGSKILIGTIDSNNGDGIKIFEHSNFEFCSISQVMKNESISMEEAYLKYYERIFMVTNAQTSILSKVNSFVKNKNKLISYEYVPRTGRYKNQVETKFVWNETLVVWLKDTTEIKNNTVVKNEGLGTLWDSISWGRLDLEGGVDFKNGKKPEILLSKIIEMATLPGDFVLDSFLGSGTTVAVAHKMGRKWIGIELGSHANTHCLPRLTNIIEGTDNSGVTELVGWGGGNGFKFYNLAPSLLKKDRFGQWVIDEKYNPNMLAAAMCKHEGFKYNPDSDVYWKHGKSTESDYIFVTTNFISLEQLDSIHSEMLEGESLLICTKSFSPDCESKYGNITIKKIPQAILGSCEFSKDNYDLNIIKSTEDIAEEQDEGVSEDE